MTPGALLGHIQVTFPPEFSGRAEGVMFCLYFCTQPNSDMLFLAKIFSVKGVRGEYPLNGEIRLVGLMGSLSLTIKNNP